MLVASKSIVFFSAILLFNLQQQQKKKKNFNIRVWICTDLIFYFFIFLILYLKYIVFCNGKLLFSDKLNAKWSLRITGIDLFRLFVGLRFCSWQILFFTVDVKLPAVDKSPVVMCANIQTSRSFAARSQITCKCTNNCWSFICAHCAWIVNSLHNQVVEKYLSETELMLCKQAERCKLASNCKKP